MNLRTRDPENPVLIHRTPFDWFLLFPVLVPLALLAAGNEDFGFDPPGWLDSFVYLGYFWHYPEHLWVFDDNNSYKISRLPWVLPGYVLHAVAGPIAASYVLAFLTLAGSAVALYLMTRESLRDRTAAAAVSVAWAACTWAHGIGGWNYHTLAASAYYLAGCWLVVRAAREPGYRIGLLAGMAVAASVHSYVFLVTFLPLVVVMFVAAVPRRAQSTWSRHVPTVAAMMGGALALTFVLAVINRSTGGGWLFFLPQIEAAWKYSQPDADLWWIGDVQRWLPGARYLVVPLAFLVAGLPVLFQRRDDRRLAVTLVTLGWGALAILAFFQFVRHQTALDYHYMAFPIYLHAFPCAAAALAAARRSDSGLVWPVAFTTAVMLGVLLLLLPDPLPARLNTLAATAGLGAMPSIVAPLVLAAIGIAVTWMLPSRARVLAFAVWFSLVNGWVAPNPSAYGLGTPGQRRDLVSLFRETDQFTTALDPTLYGIKYWMSDEELATPLGTVRLREVFDSYVATRGWFGNLLGRTAPSPPIAQLTIEDLQRGACIGVLSSVRSQRPLRDEIQARYASLDRPLREIGARRFTRGDIEFALTVLQPVSTLDAAPTSGPPCVRADDR